MTFVLTGEVVDAKISSRISSMISTSDGHISAANEVSSHNSKYANLLLYQTTENDMGIYVASLK